jgi:alkyl hydroperoxide reductase subunit F
VPASPWTGARSFIEGTFFTDTDMLDVTLKSQLQAYLQNLRAPITLIASLDESDKSVELRELLSEIASLSDKINLDESGADRRTPSFLIAKQGETRGVRFAAIPLGHEFTSLVLALLWTGGHPPKVAAEVLDQIRSLDGGNFEVYMSLACHNCPDVVQAAALMAIYNPNINTVVIDGGMYQAEVETRQVMAVPMVFRDDALFAAGHMSLEEIVARLDVHSGEREATKLTQKAPFDVLIVGGGPAGAAAAVYAARKGIRVGIAAERFGGQTNDTMAIENYISVLETDGPKFALALEAQVRHYDVDIMNLQRAERIVPAGAPGGLVAVHMENGGVLHARSVIVSTGARWRNVNVPGEAQYKNKGVAYCPHCDGPLFKGKRVAVIGGGNSGIEAAIDLAGLVQHVTVIEFADTLKADAVLVNKLKSLHNVTIHVNAQTTEITGDGQKVNGISYRDRMSEQTHHVGLEGVFVQIGLIPNTEFLKGTLDLSPFGEIVVDARCHTSLPGVFAAGDVTTVPYKQIVIAAGEGSKAALSAFDYLIRQPLAVPAESAEEAATV